MYAFFLKVGQTSMHACICNVLRGLVHVCMYVRPRNSLHISTHICWCWRLYNIYIGRYTFAVVDGRSKMEEGTREVAKGGGGEREREREQILVLGQVCL